MLVDHLSLITQHTRFSIFLFLLVIIFVLFFFHILFVRLPEALFPSLVLLPGATSASGLSSRSSWRVWAALRFDAAIVVSDRHNSMYVIPDTECFLVQTCDDTEYHRYVQQQQAVNLCSWHEFHQLLRRIYVDFKCEVGASITHRVVRYATRLIVAGTDQAGLMIGGNPEPSVINLRRQWLSLLCLFQDKDVTGSSSQSNVVIICYLNDFSMNNKHSVRCTSYSSRKLGK